MNTTTSSQNQPHPKPLILLVDDVPQNIQILHQILKDGDYSFAIATTGEDTLSIVKVKKPDLILLDIMLGDIDGFEVCKRIKEDPGTREIPIIFLTAKIAVEDKIEGFRLGAVDYITKPFEDAEVVARVRTHIQLKLSMDLLKEYNRQLTDTLGEMNSSYDELKEAQDRVVTREKEDAVRALSVTASHEMNQPLTVVIGYLELLKETMDPATHTPNQIKYLNRIETGVNRLNALMEKFRKFSHLYFLEYNASQKMVSFERKSYDH